MTKDTSPDIAEVARSVAELVAPSMSSKDLIQAVREKHPGASRNRFPGRHSTPSSWRPSRNPSVRTDYTTLRALPETISTTERCRYGSRPLVACHLAQSRDQKIAFLTPRSALNSTI